MQNHALLAVAALLAAVAASPSPAQQPEPRERAMRVAIVVFPGVELLDFAGPGEVFSAASGRDGRRFETFTVATSKERLTSQGFVHITPQYDLEDCPAPDIVVVPGGDVPRTDERLRAWLVACAEEAELMMSVCNGAGVLGAAGLLDGREVTTHHGSFHMLAGIAPTATVLTNRRFVDEGDVLTCAGVSAGIDGALHVVARLSGAEEARRVARYMEYDWRPEEIARLHAEPPRTVDDTPEAELAERVLAEGVDAVAKALTGTDEAPETAALNRSAYGLMRAGRVDRAVALMRLNCALHPDAVNARDSLAEALEREGERDEALELSRRGLEQLSSAEGLGDARRAMLDNALRSRVARLTGDDDALRYVCPPCGNDCCALRYVAASSCPGCGMQLVEADGPR